MAFTYNGKNVLVEGDTVNVPATPAPGTPTALGVTSVLDDYRTTGYTVTVTTSWTAPTEMNNFTGYMLSYEQTGSGLWIDVPCGATSTKLYGLKINTSYSYKVKSVGTGLHSDYTSVVQATTVNHVHTPATPAAPTVTAGLRNVIVEMPLHGDADIVTYELYVSTNGINGTYTHVANRPEDSRYYATNVAATVTEYAAKYRVIDAVGNTSDYSAAASDTMERILDLDVATLPTGYNLLVNADFENGLDGWTTDSGTGSVVDATGTIMSGNEMAVSALGAAWRFHNTKLMPVSPQRCYILEFYIRDNNGAGGNYQIGIQQWDGTKTKITGIKFPQTGTPASTFTLVRKVFGSGLLDYLDINCRYITVDIWLNTAGATGKQHAVQGVRIREIIESAYINDLAVTTSKIALLAVGNAQISDLAASKISLTDPVQGNIKLGKTVFSDTTNSGFWLGNDGGVAKFHIGNSANYLKFDGSSVQLAGKMTIAAGSSGYQYIADKPASLSDISSTEGTKLGGIAAGATKNTLTYSGTAPSSPTDGDIWTKTSVTPNVTYLRVSGAWQIASNYVTQSSHLTDAAAIQNSGITLNANGTISGAGGGQVTIGGLGYSGDLAATKNTITVGPTAPSLPSVGDMWCDNSGTANIWKAWTTGGWVVSATVGAQAGVNLKDAGGTVLSDPDVKNALMLIGGRNLLKNSSFELSGINLTTNAGASTLVGVAAGFLPVAGSKFLFIESNTSSSDSYLYPFADPVNVEAGKTYILSFYQQSNGTTASSSTYWRLSDNSYLWFDSSLFAWQQQGIWHRVEKQWVCPAGITSIAPRFGFYNGAGYSWMAIDCVQVEEGNKITAWTPAPEDVDIAIANVSSGTNLLSGSSTATGWDSNAHKVIFRTDGNLFSPNLNNHLPKPAAIGAINLDTTAADTMWSPAFNIVNGVTYTLHLWAASYWVTSLGRLYISIDGNASAGLDISNPSWGGGTTSNGTWEEKFFTFKATQTGTARLYLYVAGNTTIMVHAAMLNVGSTAGEWAPTSLEVQQQLNAIASDSILSKGEKPAVAKEWEKIAGTDRSTSTNGDYFQMWHAVTDLGLNPNTVMASMASTYTTLANYLGTLGLYDNPLADTNIDPTAFKNNFINYYTEYEAVRKAVTNKAATLSSWSGVSGAGKPIDNAGQVLDTRNQNNAPSSYSVGVTDEFKTRSVIGAPGSANYGGLRTVKPWVDNNGGYATQYFYSADGTFKRTAGCSDSAWGAWTTSYDEVNKPSWASGIANRPSDASLLNSMQQWADVSGSGKPADNATVGADASNLKAGVGSNLIQNPDFLNGNTSGWTIGYNNPASDLGSNLGGWYPDGGNAAFLHQPNGTSSGFAEIYSMPFPVIPGQRIEYQVKTGTHRCNGSTFLYWYSGNNVNLGYSTEVFNNEEAAGGTTLGGYKTIGSIDTVPTGVTFARQIIRKYATRSGQADSWLFFTQAFASIANAGQTQLSPWSPSVPTIGGLGYTGALNATSNIITTGTAAPSNPSDGDIWVDTNSPVTINTRVGGAWVAGGKIPTALAHVNAFEGSKLSGVAVGATANIVSSGILVNRPAGADGDFYFATDNNIFYQKVSGAWVQCANNYTDTSQLNDGASLGQTANWPQVSGSGRPADYATAGNLLNFNPACDNSNIWGTFVTQVSGGLTGNYALCGSNGQHIYENRTFSFNPARRYKVSALIRKTAGVTTGTVYIGILNYDSAGTYHYEWGGYTSWSMDATSLSTSFQRFYVELPANSQNAGTVRAAVHVILGYPNTGGGRVEFQDVTVEDTTDAYAASLVANWSGVSGIPNRFSNAIPSDPPAGLLMTDTYLGYYTAGAFNTYIKNDGTFYFKGDNNNYVYWNGTALNVRGTLNASDITTGTLDAARLSVTQLNALNITAKYVASDWVYAGTVNANNITSGTITGSTFQTRADPGTGDRSRFVISTSDNFAKFYDSDNVEKVRIGAYSSIGETSSNIAALYMSLPYNTEETGICIYGKTSSNTAMAYIQNGSFTMAGWTCYGPGLSCVGTYGAYGVGTVGGIYGTGPTGVYGSNTGRTESTKSTASGQTGVTGSVSGTGAVSFKALASNGASASYGYFTGAHMSFVPKNEYFTLGDIVVDMEIVCKRSVSDTFSNVASSKSVYQTNVLGVATSSPIPIDVAVLKDEFIDWVEFEFVSTTHNLVWVNALGEGQINVCKDGGNIQAGDYICSSSRVGKGMKQDSDLLHNYTVAKAREDCVWTESEDDIRMIACTYHCG